jgi:hypothetical protein
MKKSFRVRRPRRTMTLRLPMLAVAILLSDAGYSCDCSIDPSRRRQILEKHLLRVVANIAPTLVDDVLLEYAEQHIDWSVDRQLSWYSGFPWLNDDAVRSFMARYDPSGLESL